MIQISYGSDWDRSNDVDAHQSPRYFTHDSCHVEQQWLETVVWRIVDCCPSVAIITEANSIIVGFICGQPLIFFYPEKKEITGLAIT